MEIPGPAASEIAAGGAFATPRTFSGSSQRLWRLAGLFLALLGIVCVWSLHRRGIFQPGELIVLIDQRPAFAVLLFVATYALLVLSALPTLPLNLAAGVFWGGIAGGLLSTMGASAGAFAAFLAARGILGCPLAKRFRGDFVGWLQTEFEAKGWRFIAFLRLTPVFPTGPLNYVLGLTSIRFRTYAWATAVFLLPSSTAVAMIGHELRAYADSGDARAAVGAMLGISCAVVILVAIRYGTRYLDFKRARRT